MFPMPELEAERIRFLHEAEILGSAPEPEFDTVVALVRDLLHVPICLVSLMDTDRQWFKAKCGIEVEGTDREIAFCSYALLSDEVLVIEDALLDERFRDNPLVTGDTRIRFYAGAPLMVGPGVALGTLCVLGVEPRKLERSEILVLQRLAAVVTGLVRGHGTAHEASRLAEQMREQAHALRLRERRFEQTERIARVGGWEFDLGTEVLSWSDETYRIYGIKLGTPVDLGLALSAYTPAAGKRLAMLIDQSSGNGTGFDEEVELSSACGPRKWVRTVCEVNDLDGRPRRLFGTVQDVTERHRAEERLWRAANFDALTELANRNRFDEMLRTDGPAGETIGAMLMVDADHLKDINDTLGHDAGDELIRVVARRLRDAVNNTGTVARVGGDEFAVLLPGFVDAEALRRLAEGVLAAMQPWDRFKESTLKPIVSIGGAIRRSTDTNEDLRQAADLALYHAKENSRGGYVLYHEDMKSAITARTISVGTVDEALVAGDILAFYQPVVELATGRISGLEALARVRRPDGVHSIGAFAEALQDRRTATRLTARMLERIEADIIGWRNAGITVPRIAFNVGTLDFQEGAIESMVLSTCERAGIAPSQFAMEVTESVFLSRGANLVSETATRLRARGIIVALDDFGTGHASLAHLGTFPVDIIKMDRSFILRMNDGGPGAVVAAALIDLAHKLGIQVIAEGVEREAQLDQLIRLGCEKAQGYFFSPALSPTDVGRLLSSFGRSPHASRSEDRLVPQPSLLNGTTNGRPRGAGGKTHIQKA